MYSGTEFIFSALTTGQEEKLSVSWTVYSADIHDLTDWRCEGTIYSAGQDPHHTETVKGAGERKYLYAPDVAQGPDGRYISPGNHGGKYG